MTLAPSLRVAAALIVFAACCAARPAAASLDTSIVVPTQTRVDPRLALDASANPHVLYVSSGAIMCASRSAGVWTAEVVSAATSLPRLRALAVDPSGRRIAAYIRLGDRFVCAVRETEGWVEDSSLVDITPTTSVAFDLDPASGEPRVAYARVSNLPAGATHVICLASRSGSTWTITEVDSISTAAPHVTLCIAPSGKARIGYLDGLTYMVAREGAGGFDREPALERRVLQASLGIAPDTEEPRVAFIGHDSLIAGTDTSFFYTVGYAERAGGVWYNQPVDSPIDYFPFGVSLKSTAAGSPRLVYTKAVNVLAANAHARERLAAHDPERDAGAHPEGGVATDEVWLATRPAAAPYTPFQLERVDSWNTLSNTGSLALAASGHAYVVMRSPDFSALYHIILAEESAPASAPEAEAGGLLLAPPVPNPAPRVHGGTVDFTLPRETAVTIELYDLTGARRAALAPRAYPAGRSLVPWAPRDLPSGLYWLRIQTGFGASATRKWVLF